MAITMLTTNEVLSAGRDVLAAHGARAGATWLLPDRERAFARRRSLACAGEGAGWAFGVSCAAFDDFLEDWWGLFGSGEAFVSELTRLLLVRRALREACALDGVALRDAEGVVDLLARAVRTGAGLPEFERAAARPDAVPGLIASEVEVLRVAGRYEALLARAGLCEPSQALWALSQADVAWPTMVVEGVSSLDVAWARFFVAAGRRTDVVFLVEGDAGSGFDSGRALAAQLDAAGAAPARARDAFSLADGRAVELEAISAALYGLHDGYAVQPTGALRVALPAGRVAEARTIADVVSQTQATDVAVACNDPYAKAAVLADVFAAQGVEVRASGSRPFVQTDFGRAVVNATALAGAATPDCAAAADLASSFLAGVGRETSRALGAKWRGNRLVSCEDMLDDMEAAACDEGRLFLQAMRSGDLRAASLHAQARFEAAVGAVSAAFRAENLAAVRAAQRFCDGVVAFGLQPLDELDLLAGRSVACSCSWRPQEPTGAVVAVMSYEAASRLPRASAQLVVVCDLNDVEQPVRAARSPLDALFEKLGCPAPADALGQQRARFAAILRAAREGVVLVRVLHDAESSPMNPAVVFEDVLDCYRLCAGGHDDRDKETGLPAALLPFAGGRGEETLGADLGGLASDNRWAPLSCGPVDAVSKETADPVLVPRFDVPSLRGEPALSASALEDYLGCPYQWFAKRRLGLSTPDAGLGPLEKGTFFHAVLRRYYEHWRVEGAAPKACGAELDAADELLDAAFDEELAAQRERSPHQNPLLPLSETERLQVEDMRRSLHEFLRTDAALAPSFSPAFFELSFGRDVRVEYAGVAVVGTIDRIDVDAKGRALVIDYKSSLNDGYCLLEAASAPFTLPKRVQALVYAQVARRLTGAKVAAAVYANVLGSKSQARIAGAYDETILGSEDLLGIKPQRSTVQAAGFATFEGLLDAVEEQVAEAVVRLAAGDVRRAPRDADACKYCPVLGCEGRL